MIYITAIANKGHRFKKKFQGILLCTKNSNNEIESNYWSFYPDFNFRVGCKKDNPASVINPPDNYMVGSWRISSFVDGNVNQTSHFSDYTFICDAYGNMSICMNGDTIYCNWQWGDDTHSMCNFDIMGCNNNSYLWDLNYNWNITGHDDMNCYFANDDSHGDCNDMMNHSRTMTWSRN